MNKEDFLDFCRATDHAIGHTCPDCGNKWIFFEGLLDTFWKKLQEPCTRCGSTKEQILTIEEDAEL